MLWDCPACATTKLLGVDHRYCPNCGSPQEENLRYFPAPGDRVPTKFLGRDPDWECERCGVPNGGNNCMGCGAPHGGSQGVHVRASIPEGSSETGVQAKRDWEGRRASRRAQQHKAAGMDAHAERERARAQRYEERRATAERATAQSAGVKWVSRPVSWGRQNRAAAGIGTAAFLVLAFILTCAFWKKDVEVVTQAHTWERGISVERYAPVQDDDWCSSMPIDAYSVSRRSEVHHHDRVYDGEECHTVPGGCTESCRNVDNGNGSYSVDCTQSCTPDRESCRSVYHDEPVYKDKCYYTVDRWRHNRWDTARGSQLEPEPYWSEPQYKSCTGRFGCERLGSKKQSYTVHYIAPEEEAMTFTCEYPQEKWASILPDSRWIARVGVIWERIDCDSLRTPEG
jgi:hypothetical protein